MATLPEKIKQRFEKYHNRYLFLGACFIVSIFLSMNVEEEIFLTITMKAIALYIFGEFAHLMLRAKEIKNQEKVETELRSHIRELERKPQHHQPSSGAMCGQDGHVPRKTATAHKIVPILFIFGIIVTGSIRYADAASGACSSHGGVKCSAGADIDGSVICNDGWTDSSVSFSSANECMIPPTSSGCKTESDYGVMQVRLNSSGGYLGPSASSQGALNQCRSEINAYQASLQNTSPYSTGPSTPASNSTDVYLQSKMQEFCHNTYGSQSYSDYSAKTCRCNNGYTLSNGGQCVPVTHMCGLNSSFDTYKQSCTCNPGYVKEDYPIMPSCIPQDSYKPCDSQTWGADGQCIVPNATNSPKPVPPNPAYRIDIPIETEPVIKPAAIQKKIKPTENKPIKLVSQEQATTSSTTINAVPIIKTPSTNQNERSVPTSLIGTIFRSIAKYLGF